jgi:alkylation response protein AidB-like acyl-CoA dehydrogenase
MPADVAVALGQRAEVADAKPEWPEESWDWVYRAGALAWCIPEMYGGAGLRGVELLDRYEGLAAACLTSCFILSQRDAACRRILDHGSPELCRELLPPLARGERFATVGLSHLTTSRQHTAPAMTATYRRDCLVLDGAMPWVTGASRADHFVTGAVVEDGRQVLLVLPRATAGVRVGAPLDLMALAGSVTAEVRCERVKVDRRWLLAGPAERVLTVGRAGTGGLETSCVALGLAGAAIGHLAAEAAARPDLQATQQRLGQSADVVRSELRRLAAGSGGPEAALALRARANALVLRATQAALTASKGTGFLRSHPAQRWARQALFFLVWSCPRLAADATLAYLMPSDAPVCT